MPLNASNPPELAIDRRAPVRRIQLDADSWIDVVDGFVKSPIDEFTSIRESTRWQQNAVLRYDKYVPERRLSAGLRAENNTLLRQTNLHLRAAYDVSLAGVAAVLYRDGNDFQGLHSDRDMRWLTDTRVAIVVLGERRPFVIRKRQPLSQVIEKVPSGADPDDLVLMPGQGDLLVMGGACQRDWLHGIPAATTDMARISLTWRWTSRNGPPDQLPKYSEGRQFSDRPRQPGTRRSTAS